MSGTTTGTTGAFPPDTGIAGTGTREAQVTRLYDVVFDRAPDSEGLAFWTAALNRGVTLDTVADLLVRSAEFQSLGALGDADFVGLLYRNGLERAADAPGLNFWTGGLQQNTIDRGGVALAISESAEGVASSLTRDTAVAGTGTGTGTGAGATGTGTGATSDGTGTAGTGTGTTSASADGTATGAGTGAAGTQAADGSTGTTDADPDGTGAQAAGDTSGTGSDGSGDGAGAQAAGGTTGTGGAGAQATDGTTGTGGAGAQAAGDTSGAGSDGTGAQAADTSSTGSDGSGDGAGAQAAGGSGTDTGLGDDTPSTFVQIRTPDDELLTVRVVGQDLPVGSEVVNTAVADDAPDAVVFPEDAQEDASATSPEWFIG